MAFASFDSHRSAAPMNEINLVPLIDVMLLLRVIFVVTAPLLCHSVKLEPPKASSTVDEDRLRQRARSALTRAEGGLGAQAAPGGARSSSIASP